MADFYQNGTITTLHNLGERSTADLEQDLVQFSERRPLGLILPSLYSEIETPALPAIIEELKGVPYFVSGGHWVGSCQRGRVSACTELLR